MGRAGNSFLTCRNLYPGAYYGLVCDSRGPYGFSLVLKNTADGTVFDFSGDFDFAVDLYPAPGCKEIQDWQGKNQCGQSCREARAGREDYKRI